MILLLGSSGYIGSAFVAEMTRRGIEHRALSGVRLSNMETMLGNISYSRPSAVINCGAYIPKPSVDACKDNKYATVMANAAFPVELAKLCVAGNIPLAHISTGCLYDEAKEYAEGDAPTRGVNQYAGFYVLTKYMSELFVQGQCPNSWVWRIRLPFDEVDSPRNYLSKLKSFGEVWDQNNSLTHRGDFVKSALDMIEKRVPFGVYNMTNSGTASAAWLAQYIQMKTGYPMLSRDIVKGPVPGSMLSTAKLESTGCGMRPVSEAVAEALKEWRTA